MKAPLVHINLVAAWTGILLGFLSGMVQGMFFHRENWLGGYGSFKRRMYRLGHISLFGLGAVNLMFYLTVRSTGISDSLLNVAAWAFVVGAVTMPVCCVIMAHAPKLHMIFAVPVISLIVGGLLTLILVVRNHEEKEIAASSKTVCVPSYGQPQTCLPRIPPGPWTLNSI